MQIARKVAPSQKGAGNLQVSGVGKARLFSTTFSRGGLVFLGPERVHQPD